MTAEEISILETVTIELAKGLAAAYAEYHAAHTVAGTQPLTLEQVIAKAAEGAADLPGALAADGAVADNALADKFDKGTP